MALDPVTKVEITAHNAVLDDILEEVQILSVMQIDPHRIREYECEKQLIARSEQQSGVLKSRAADAQRAIDFLQPFSPKLTIIQKLSKEPDFKSRKELQAVAAQSGTGAGGTAAVKPPDLVEQALDLERQISGTEAAKKELQQKIAGFEPLAGLTVGLEKLGRGRDVDAYVARVDSEVYGELAAQAGHGLVHLERVHPADDEVKSDTVYFLLVYHHEAREIAEGLEKQFRYEPISLSSESGTAAHIIEQSRKQIKELDTRRGQLQEQAARLAGHLPVIRYYYDYLQTETEKEFSKQRFFFTQQVSLVQGWIKVRDLPALEEVLGRYKEAHFSRIAPEEGEVPPVAYRNNQVVAPFEIIVNLYSPPNHREIDPTPVLMPFYALFFGICLTDAGYGLVTALVAAVAMAMIKVENGVKKFMRLFFILGCVTFVIGALIGTVFGINFDLLPENLAWLREARESIMIFDSSQDVLTFFGLSLALGVIHIITGYIIKMYMLFKSGEWAEAVCDHLPWVIILLSPAPLVLKQFMPGIQNPMNLFLIMFLLGAGILLFFSERTTLNPVKRIGKGIFTIYGITGVLGDVLSYSRLLALGLATGVIAGVMNTLASMVGQIPVVGVVGLVMVLIFGHLFNLFISGLSAFVHSIRLQFMEFFTKFYTGEGELLSAFSEKRTYTYPVRNSTK
jgi:V/A-type H+-transporting ATPase subunit I